MDCIYHCFWIEAPLATVNTALTDKASLAGWWTRSVEGEGTPDSVWTFRFASGAFNRMKIEQLEPDRVVWKCVAGNEEWIGTHVQFVLSEDRERVKVRFSHSGWREQTDYMGECSFHWANYLRSLQDFCRSGKGSPNVGV